MKLADIPIETVEKAIQYEPVEDTIARELDRLWTRRMGEYEARLQFVESAIRLLMNAESWRIEKAKAKNGVTE